MAKLTQSTRMALEIFVSENVDNFMDWLRAIEDPKEKCDIFLKVLQYYMPRLAQVTGTINVKHTLADFTDEELAVIAVQDGIDTPTFPIIDLKGGAQRPN